MSKTIKISDLDGKNQIKKEDSHSLRGRVFILDVENSEIAKNLEITEKGIYGARFR